MMRKVAQAWMRAVFDLEVRRKPQASLSYELCLSDHLQDKKIPVYESFVTQCCPGIGMVVLIQ
jgi:hypothetical protein